MGIRFKFLLYVALPLVVSVFFAVFYASSKSFSALSESFRQRFMLDTEAVADRISAENIRGISVAKSSAAAAEIFFGNRSASVNMIRRTLDSFPIFSGASVSYTVNADFNDFRSELGLKNIRDGKDVYADGALDTYEFSSNRTNVSIDEWIAASNGGRFGAYWCRVDGELALSPITDGDLAVYSSALKKRVDSGEKDLYIVCEPYIAGGKTMSVEYAAAIVSDGRYSGQVSFICDMSRIQSILASMRFSSEDEFFLISPQDRVIASSKFETLKTIPVSDFYLDNAGNLVQSFFKEEGGLLVRDDSAAAKMDFSKYDGFYKDLLQSVLAVAKNTVSTDLSEKKLAVFTGSRGRSYYVDFSVVRAGRWIVVHVCPQSALAAAYSSATWGYFTAAVAAVATLFLGFAMFSRMSARLVKCVACADKISAGVFDDSQLGKTGGDEVGRLSRSLSRAVRKMDSAFSSVGVARGEFSAAAKLLAASLDDYSFQSNSIGMQTAKIVNALKSVAEKNRTLSADVDKIQKQLAASLEYGESARKDISQVDGLTESFSRSANASIRRNAGLNDRINGITGISAEISKVADESSLLSLNASIEAEKSGKFGSGFSVVAREIGRISENISRSSAEMKSIVRDIQASISRDLSDSGRMLESIGEFSLKYSKMLSNMDAAVEHMKTVVPSMESLSEECASNAGDSERAFDMVSELSDSVETLNELRLDLQTSAANLGEKLDKLKTDFSDFGAEK